MAGCSPNPALAKKIGVKPELEVLLRNAPGDWSIPGEDHGHRVNPPGGGRGDQQQR